MASSDKSGFLRTQRGFGYGDVKRFRDPNQTNVDKGILKLRGNSATDGGRTVLGIISVRVDGLLIFGSSEFIGYISWRMEENSM